MFRILGVLTTVMLAASLITAATATAVPAASSPTEFRLPDGFQPEGIAIGAAPIAYFGSMADGDLFRVDLRTGRGEVFSQGPGTPTVGLKIDQRRRLFVAGGRAGDARVVDARTGAVLKSYKFADTRTFVNDVVITSSAAYFTDSSKAVLYTLAFGPRGELPEHHTTIPLSGDFALEPGYNANGIAQTPNHQALLIVQSNTGKLYQASKYSGKTTVVDLGGQILTSGDGILVRGQTLYVVRAFLSRIDILTLTPDGSSGKLVKTITDPRFDEPTTVAAFGNRLYLPNARLTTPPTPTTTYTAVSVYRR